MDRSIFFSIFLVFWTSLLNAETYLSHKNEKELNLAEVFVNSKFSLKELRKVKAGDVKIEISNKEIHKIIVASLKDTYIVSGKRLQIIDFLDEQKRIAELLHHHGYKLIEPADIRFKIIEDSLLKDISIVFSGEIASNKLTPVSIRKTIVLQNLISPEAIMSGTPCKDYGNATIYGPGTHFVEIAPVVSLIYENNEVFSLEKELSMRFALTQLKGVSTVDVEYLPVSSSCLPEADCIIYLSTSLFSGK